jgi:hypothetical protein
MYSGCKANQRRCKETWPSTVCTQDVKQSKDAVRKPDQVCTGDVKLTKDAVRKPDQVCTQDVKETKDIVRKPDQVCTHTVKLTTDAVWTPDQVCTRDEKLAKNNARKPKHFLIMESDQILRKKFTQVQSAETGRGFQSSNSARYAKQKTHYQVGNLPNSENGKLAIHSEWKDGKPD